MTATTAPLFRDQAATFLRQGTARKRNPFRPATQLTYKSQIETHLNPVIGKLPLDTVGNKAVKQVAQKMADSGASAATIQLNINIIKQIRSSAVGSEGEQLYPYTWNSDFIDAPVIDKQKRPIASAQAVQDGLKCLSGRDRALVGLLAGSGLRVQEILALHAGPDDGIGSFWIPAEHKLVIRQQRHGKTFGPTKTKAGVREVDISGDLNNLLEQNLQVPSGLTVPYVLFPGAQSAYRLKLRGCGILGGFHSLRRFRVTHLRLQGVPDSLIHFWVGHEDSTVTDRYTKVGTEIEARKTWAEKAGLGFSTELS